VKINQNEMAQSIVAAEGGKVNLSIGQVKEVQRLTLRELAIEWENGNELGVIGLIKDAQAKLMKE